MNNKFLNRSEKDSVKAEIKKVIQERVGEVMNKLSSLKENNSTVDNAELKIAMEPIIGMTPKQIADKIIPILSGEAMNEASEEGKSVIKKYIARALTGLGVTTSIASVVYAALFASPQTRTIVEKIIDGTLPADVTLVAGIIGIVLGGIIDSIDLGSFNSTKKKLDELSPELRQRAFDTAKSNFEKATEDDEINREILRKQADKFATHINPEVEGKIKRAADSAGLNVEIIRAVSSDNKPYVQLFFLEKDSGTPSKYNKLFYVSVTKDSYSVRDRENLPASFLKLLSNIIKNIQANEL